MAQSFQRPIAVIDSVIDGLRKANQKLDESNVNLNQQVATNREMIEENNRIIEEYESAKKLLEGAFD